MNETQRAALLQSQAVAAMIEALGMQAENQHRVSCGNSIAYGEEAFQALIDKYQIGWNAAMAMLQGG